MKTPPLGRPLAGMVGMAVLLAAMAGRTEAQGGAAASVDPPVADRGAAEPVATEPVAALPVAVDPRPAEPPRALESPLARGKASWYGLKFHGRRTASGERFDMNELTAAHGSLPFGTRVRVRNVANGREVIVRINDRGPRSRHRIIDLSKAAAAALGFLHAGEAPVVLIKH